MSRKILLDDSDGSSSAGPRPREEVEKVEVNVGDIITGAVVNIAKFGAFVEIAPGTDGMVHISELENYRVAKVEDVVSVGEEITVEVIAVDDTGRIKLSRKALLTD